MTDNPNAPLPLYFNGIRQLPMVMGILSDYFNVYIAARTTQEVPQFLPMAMSGLLPQGLSNKLYFSEAFANWYLTFAVVAKAGGVVANVSGGATAWAHQQAPFLPDVNVVPANIGANAPFATWEQ